MSYITNMIYPYILGYLEVFLKVILAVILGGMIGLERESINRPAGFRTHILVCVGAALVMIISEELFEQYHGLTTADPARLGAQVISGIGFLGAGTIIKDGVTVKGLTTAATLWAVSCIGLAIGGGYYAPAIITSIVVYVVLILFNRIDVVSLKKNRRHVAMKLEINNNENALSNIEAILIETGVKIKGIRYLNHNNDTSEIKVFLTVDNSKQYDDIVNLITDISGVKRVIQY